MTYDEFCHRLQLKLNPQQKEAVQAVEGPILLLAVPGSGKTTVLVARLGYMIYCAGIAPENILVLTYTVAAAGDMGRRFRFFFGEELGNRLEFRTINGTARRYYSMVGAGCQITCKGIFNIKYVCSYVFSCKYVKYVLLYNCKGGSIYDIQRSRPAPKG